MPDEEIASEKPDNEMVKAAYEALMAKGQLYKDYENYYNGDQPTVYLTALLKETFKAVNVSINENWCAVVIDAATDRIELKSLTSKEEAVNTKLTDIWTEQLIELESQDIISDTLITGEGFAIAWPEGNTEGDAEDGKATVSKANKAEFYRNDPAIIHVEYKADNPRKKAWAAKWFDMEDGRKKLVIYYDERIDYYESTSKANEISDYKNFQPAEPPSETNTYKQIPVFHFRLSGRGVKSDLKNAIPIQDAINKLLIDMLVAADYGAYKQRYVISDSEGLGKLKNAPNEVWIIPPGDGVGQSTTVGEFEAADLGQYLDSIDKLAASLSSITRTPKHFFFSQAGELSGEALMTLEAPLVKKAKRYIARFMPTWSELASFMLKIEGVEADPNTITPVFADPRSVQPVTEATVRAQGRTAGIPLKTLLRDEGKDEEWLKQMDKDKAEEDAAKQEMLAQTLVRTQRNFDQNNSNLK